MKIIYIMNVDWNWIKQRPHFIAEGLSEKYDVKIIYRYRYNRKKLQKRDNEGLNLHPIYVIPKLSAIKNFKWINDALFNMKVRNIIKRENPDFIYLTYPSQIKAIPKLYIGKIIYDCMDNHSAFCDDCAERSEIETKEKELIIRSTKTFVSSQYLLDLNKNRYHIAEEKFSLVRNAYSGNILSNVNNKKATSAFKMAYIGTISSWFDWETIRYILSENKNIQLHLYGPLDKSTIPEGNNIIYHGTIEHDKLYEAIQDVDCLIMPFLINDIIKAVDPVKIYEYINFKKDIIMSFYDEVKRLKDFVYFYKSPKEFSLAIKNINGNPNTKYSEEQRRVFLQENNWSNRVSQIATEIDKL